MQSSKSNPSKNLSKLENKYEECVKHRSECGNFITCKICFDWNPHNNSNHKFGVIKMRSPFQVYNFKRHVDSSSMHMESTMKMNHVKVNGKKKSTQLLLPFAKKPKSSQEVIQRIAIAGVSPVNAMRGGTMGEDSSSQSKLFSGSIVESTKVSKVVAITSLQKLPPDNICRGVLSNSDLFNSDLQNAINVYMEYYDYSKTNVKFIPKKIHEDYKFLSFFSSSCLVSEQVR